MHWPMQIAFRIAPGAARASGLRQRSQEATERRNQKKAERGYGPLAKQHATGRSSGSQQPWQAALSRSSSSQQQWQASWQASWQDWQSSWWGSSEWQGRRWWD